MFCDAEKMFVCIGSSRPELFPASVSERDVGERECVVNVEWSEAFVSCGGSVSQYVLSVTPPTSDCQLESNQSCLISTNNMQFNLTVTTDTSYNVTVRADTCTNSLRGPESAPISINFAGQ